MKEKELKLILDRSKHEIDVATHFSQHVELLEDMVNYGSNLVMRSFDSSNKKLEDIIVIGVLLKQVVAMIDAVAVLVSKACVRPAHLQARSAFEASLYIDWILHAEPVKKAKYYYVSDLRSQRLWALRCIEGSPESQRFSAIFGDLADDVTSSTDIVDVAQANLKKIDYILSRPAWKDINSEFEGKVNKKSFDEPYWYKLLGVRSIRHLAEVVGRQSLYHLYYSRSSEVMHISPLKDHVQFSKGAVIFEPIRQLNDINFVLRFASQIAISTYKSILMHYRPGELDSFKIKYLRDWRYSFINIPEVSYTVEPRIFGT